MSNSDKRNNASTNDPFAGSIYQDDRPSSETDSIVSSDTFKEKIRAKNEQGNTALVTSIQNKELRTGSFLWTPTGLELTAQPTREDWEFTGEMLHMLDTSLQWLIGDWLLAGEQLKYGDRETFAHKLGFEASSLYDYTYVARSVDFSIRIENLSFGHHQLVAGMKDPKTKEPLIKEQSYWLNEAVTNKWSIKEMREAIKESRGQSKVLPSVFQRFESKLSSFSKGQLDLIAQMNEDERLAAAGQLIDLAERIKTGKG